MANAVQRKSDAFYDGVMWNQFVSSPYVVLASSRNVRNSTVMPGDGTLSRNLCHCTAARGISVMAAVGGVADRIALFAS